MLRETMAVVVMILLGELVLRKSGKVNLVANMHAICVTL